MLARRNRSALVLMHVSPGDGALAPGVASGKTSANQPPNSSGWNGICEQRVFQYLRRFAAGEPAGRSSVWRQHQSDWHHHGPGTTMARASAAKSRSRVTWKPRRCTVVPCPEDSSTCRSLLAGDSKGKIRLQTGSWIVNPMVFGLTSAQPSNSCRRGSRGSARRGWPFPRRAVAAATLGCRKK